ncbi:hypothetical protein BN7_5438 [Wickerhamomyces ciferrii]|uniref:Uncharacterized protein n=1 Tax=Wickerhamomyces ciferrii (strain ATCC 14091 / BCRC 22168 / CBS 111 / JCM 3599 / NBRC 0793 / NRRL Y-1031 F-60-10) TaxID=1206466 RepID=K0KVC1_WICCF|nr:uncharacterized protein BN7_5438 [Wickerhamomyces ciferrii]CCH45852.1 hypothetical protein BN7_5438 [Wickerhamomyces ciferrii]
MDHYSHTQYKDTEGVEANTESIEKFVPEHQFPFDQSIRDATPSNINSIKKDSGDAVVEESQVRRAMAVSFPRRSESAYKQYESVTKRKNEAINNGTKNYLQKYYQPEVYNSIITNKKLGEGNVRIGHSTVKPRSTFKIEKGTEKGDLILNIIVQIGLALKTGITNHNTKNDQKASSVLYELTNVYIGGSTFKGLFNDTIFKNQKVIKCDKIKELAENHSQKVSKCCLNFQDMIKVY